MMPSLPIHQPSDARHSGWLPAQHSPRLLPIDKSARIRTADPVRRRPFRCLGPPPAHPFFEAKRLVRVLCSNLAHPDAQAKSP
jgi:hypothetical protein